MTPAPHLRLLALAALVFACRGGATDPVSPPEAPPPETAAAAIDEAPASPPAEVRAPACALTLPPPIEVEPGPAYVLVHDVGVVEIDDTGARDLLPRFATGGVSIVAGPDRALWVADREDGVLARAADGRLTHLPRPPGDAWVRRLAIRGPGEVWAATDEIEWRILRHDGRRWHLERRRRDFAGRYDDNKFVDLAVADDGAWVSSWNGLWRAQKGRWQRIDAPDSSGVETDLWTSRGALIAGGHDGVSRRRDDQWEALAWPRTNDTRRALGDVGLVVAPVRPGARVELGSIVDEVCRVAGEPLPGSTIEALAVDGRGRAWVASDRALAVLEVDGRVAALWPIGALPGLTARIEAIVVPGAGPSTLPPAAPVATRRVRGRLRVHRGGRPLIGATIELCATVGSGPCPDASLVGRTSTSGPDGAYEFPAVPDGDFWIRVTPPADLDDCQGIFSVSGGHLSTSKDCPKGQLCDLGEQDECLPFEMPPPR